MRLLKCIEKQYVKIILAVCCCALGTIAESRAAVELKYGQQDEIEGGEWMEQIGGHASTDRLFEFFLGAGSRKDNLDWNIAGGSVNILSELKWENLKIAQISAAARLNIDAGWNLRGMLAYGRINSGSNQDSDYNGNNRTVEFSRSNNKGGGEVRDGSIGLGRTLLLLNDADGNSLSVTPLAGLSIHRQNLTMTEGLQTVCDLCQTGPFPGLNSSYDAQWQGPWVGMEVLQESGGDWSLTATWEYHWADYSAQANWNLRPEFSHPVSFVHTANGQGILLAAGAAYLVSKDWRVGFSVQTQQWSTGRGIDKTFFSDGSVGYSPLNGVNWQSKAINLGIVHHF